MSGREVMRPRLRAGLGAGVVAMVVAAGCGPSGAPTTVPAPVDCAAADTTAGIRIASVFIDGRRVAAGRKARLDQPFPETYALEGEEPAEVKALPVERIDLIQFLRGEEAERVHQLCPGGVAFLITTRGER